MMDGPMQLLPDWLMPDDQAGDWYQWVVVASGHVMLGVAALVPLRLVMPPAVAWTICLSIYAAIEALQLAVGGGLLDGLTDALFVVSGMLIAGEAVKREPYGFAAMIGFLTLAVLTGVALRT